MNHYLHKEDEKRNTNNSQNNLRNPRNIFLTGFLIAAGILPSIPYTTKAADGSKIKTSDGSVVAKQLEGSEAETALSETEHLSLQVTPAEISYPDDFTGRDTLTVTTQLTLRSPKDSVQRDFPVTYKTKSNHPSVDNGKPTIHSKVSFNQTPGTITFPSTFSSDTIKNLIGNKGESVSIIAIVTYTDPKTGLQKNEKVQVKILIKQ